MVTKKSGETRMSIPLDDGDGWFDSSKAELFHDNLGEDTDTTVERSILYRTASGGWVLCSWQYEESDLSHRRINEDDALQWLLQKRHFDVAERFFPDKLKELEV